MPSDSVTAQVAKTYPDPGFVYLLTNVAMPGYVKIGLTRQDDVEKRMSQLYTTSLPFPFECVYAAKVPDCEKLEKVLHKVFGDKRANASREFFTADPKLAELIIDLVKIEDRVVTDAEQGISPEERVELETAKAKQAPRLDLLALGLRPGDVLTFSKDLSVTCTVAGAGKVLFQGETLSPSAAALKAIHALGYTWPAVSGSEYWMYDGVKLSTLRAQMQGADQATAQPAARSSHST